LARFARMNHISISDAIMTYIVFLYSTVLHEAAHAWTGWRLGDDTAYRGGQVSLDPTPHIKREPIGMVAVPLLSLFLGGWVVGWASAPYDPQWERRHPMRSALMAMAGPASNLALLLLAALGIRLGIAAGEFSAPARPLWAQMVSPVAEGGMWAFAATFLSILFSLNLLLAIFNLLPVPPLDGRAIPLFFLRGRAVDSYLDFIRQPNFGMIGLLISWQAFRWIYPPLQSLAVHLLYPGVYS
jgi:Zn-dependent protease